MVILGADHARRVITTARCTASGLRAQRSQAGRARGRGRTRVHLRPQATPPYSVQAPGAGGSRDHVAAPRACAAQRSGPSVFGAQQLAFGLLDRVSTSQMVRRAPPRPIDTMTPRHGVRQVRQVLAGHLDRAAANTSASCRRGAGHHQQPFVAAPAATLPWPGTTSLLAAADDGAAQHAVMADPGRGAC